MNSSPCAYHVNPVQLLPWLRCPHCHGTLAEGVAALVCASCGRHYPVTEAIIELLDDESQSTGTTHSERYTRSFQTAERSREYKRAFESDTRLKLRTRRESRILARLLASRPVSERLLNIPCGWGRLSAPLARRTGCLIEADTSRAQVSIARTECATDTPSVWMTASALAIPLADAAVDGAVCARLSHHLPAAQQDRLCGELLRVARHFIIYSYRDKQSLLHLWRRLRGKPASRYTLGREDVQRLATRHGGRVIADHALSWLGSRHRYALIEKRR